MQYTKIEWVKNPDGTQGYTWNPITGCLNRCPYCYARRLANGRLKRKYLANRNLAFPLIGSELLKTYSNPFYPRFWPERLEEPTAVNRTKGIFVCDMSDLFGLGIPNQWTEAVLRAIQVTGSAYKHRFYLLTKQPQNLAKWSPFPPNCWVGVSATDYSSFVMACGELGALKHKSEIHLAYLSLEPLLMLNWDGDSSFILPWLVHGEIDWVIIGAMTGTLKDIKKACIWADKALKPMPLNRNRWSLQPPIEWVKEIVEAADKAGIPVFLKNNLLPILPSNTPDSPFHFGVHGVRQEMPEEGKG